MLNSHVFALYNSFAVHWDRPKYLGVPKIQYFFDFCVISMKKPVKKYPYRPERIGFFSANGDFFLNSVKRVWKWRKFAKKYIETKNFQISDLDPPLPP